MPAKTDKPPAYAELVVQAVRESRQPLTFDEIVTAVAKQRPITTNSPKSTIRSALASTRLIAHNNAGKYGWYPRLLRGAHVRIPFSPSGLKLDPPRIALSHEARDLLWPGFFDRKYGFSQDEIVHVTLPDGTRCTLSLDMIGSGNWVALPTSEFAQWVQAVGAHEGDDFIMIGSDPEHRQYQITLDVAKTRDNAARQRHTFEVLEQGAQIVLSGRGRNIYASWEAAHYLLASGAMHDPVPPSPLDGIWRAIFLLAAENLQRPKSVHQLKVTLQDSKPKIWRRICVPSHWTLATLHYVLQFAMGWTNSHLHQFSVGEPQKQAFYSLYRDEDYDLDVKDARKTQLKTIAPHVGDHFEYEYDFGDSWRHTIEVESISPPEAYVIYPVCLAGERAAPPDDCGGVHDYADLLKVLANKRHAEYQDSWEWVRSMKGPAWRPDYFDVAQTTQHMYCVNPKVHAAEEYAALFRRLSEELD